MNAYIHVFAMIKRINERMGYDTTSAVVLGTICQLKTSWEDEEMQSADDELAHIPETILTRIVDGYRDEYLSRNVIGMLEAVEMMGELT